MLECGGEVAEEPVRPGAEGRCVGGMRLSEALDGIRLAYNPITKQLHFVSPRPSSEPRPPSLAGLSKKDSFSDEGTGSVSTCERSDTSDSPRSTLPRAGAGAGHRRGDGSFSSTVSSLSEGSLSAGYASREEEEARVEERGEPARPAPPGSDDTSKLKKKGLSSFFSRGVFPWRSSGSVSGTQKQQNASSSSAVGVSWRLFGGKSSDSSAGASGGEVGGGGGEAGGPPSESRPACLSAAAAAAASAAAAAAAAAATPSSSGSGATSPHHHRRQGSSASEKQFEDLVASSIALIQHDRPSNLPAKCEEEALRHRQEHARLVAAARRRGGREAAARRARAHDALLHEERLARHAREWTAGLLGGWENMKSSKRTQELWWSGLPPSIRGKVWPLAIGNELGITLDMYHECVARAKRRLHEAQLRRKRLKRQADTHAQRDRIDCSGCRRNEDTRDIDGHDRTDLPHKNEITSKIHEHGLPSNNCERSQHENGQAEVNTDESTPKSTAGDTSKGPPVGQNGMHRNFSEQNLKSHCAERAASAASAARAASAGRAGRAGRAARQSSRSNPNLAECGDECSVELIQLDIARTFPHLCMFQPDGPYFDTLHELLAAYACYRPDVGYVQGMSFIGAMLILNMEAPQAFVCFANLLEEPVLKAAFTRDGATMQRLWAAYGRLVRANVPALAGRVAPELYLLEWLYTAFAKAMPLDTACRVWDLCLRDGGAFLFRTALGVLHLYQETLKEMDFITAAQFLTKLPEDLCSDALFRSISAVSMSLDGLSFQRLADSCAPAGAGEAGEADAAGL